jgi:hypothetical protein
LNSVTQASINLLDIWRAKQDPESVQLDLFPHVTSINLVGDCSVEHRPFLRFVGLQLDAERWRHCPILCEPAATPHLRKQKGLFDNAKSLWET